LYVFEILDFWLCPPILNSHSIRACICLRRKFNNQQNAQRTVAVHYKHLRRTLHLPLHFFILFDKDQICAVKVHVTWSCSEVVERAGCCRWWKSWWKAFVRVESLLLCEFVSAL